jgi:hypothetical protein
MWEFLYFSICCLYKVAAPCSLLVGWVVVWLVGFVGCLVWFVGLVVWFVGLVVWFVG